jgi:hypothetical protein
MSGLWKPNGNNSHPNRSKSWEANPREIPSHEPFITDVHRPVCAERQKEACIRLIAPFLMLATNGAGKRRVKQWEVI